MAEQDPENIVGICLSGGGVRSAAFSLGALQALQDEEGLLSGDAHAAYLAAVSGGSYAASAMLTVAGGALATPSRPSSGRSWATVEPPIDRDDGHPEYENSNGRIRSIFHFIFRIFEVPSAKKERPDWQSVPVEGPFAPRSFESQYIRNHARYLLEGSPATTVLALFYFLILPPFMIVTIAILLGHILGIVSHGIEPGYFWLVILADVLLVVYATALPLVFMSARRVETAEFKDTSEVRLQDLLSALVFLNVVVLVAYVYEANAEALPHWDVSTAAILPAISGGSSLFGLSLVGLIRAQIAPKKTTAGIGSRGLAIIIRVLIALVQGILLILIPAMFIWAFTLGWLGKVNDLTEVLGIQGWILWASLAYATLLVYILGDRVLSPRGFYQSRLTAGFSIVRQESASTGCLRARRRQVSPPLSALRGLKTPELLICASVSMSEPGVAAAGAHVKQIVFSPSNIYLPGVEGALVDTKDYETVIGRPASVWSHSFDASIISYVALTGAAVAPAMGRFTRSWLRSVLFVTNMRLGTWIPNPASPKIQAAVGGDPPTLHRFLNKCPGPVLWLREARGHHYLRTPYVYVSDGGHYENLGLVELVRRGCTEVWCVDASGDDRGSWTTLAESLNLLASEEGYAVDGDFEAFLEAPEEADPKGELVARVWTTVHLRRKRPDVHGCTVHVVKIGMDKDTHPAIRQLGKKFRRFPYDSTLNQLYNADRFDAYRSLGYDSTLAALNRRGDVAVPVEPIIGQVSKLGPLSRLKEAVTNFNGRRSTAAR